MKILFFHGLESKLNAPKRKVLEQYGTVQAPDLEYKSDPNIIPKMQQHIVEWQPDVLIGSSMGGFTGFFLAQMTGVPALLYNPAVLSGRRYQIVPENLPPHFTAPVQIILGGKDPIVLSSSTRLFLRTHYRTEDHFHVKTIADMAHRIPFDVFEMETHAFFKEYF